MKMSPKLKTCRENLHPLERIQLGEVELDKCRQITGAEPAQPSLTSPALPLLGSVFQSRACSSGNWDLVECGADLKEPRDGCLLPRL
jgi:hypothetical protein